MAQFETTGGGTTENNGKRVERRVVVATGGQSPVQPDADGALTYKSVTLEPGGIRRGIYEFTTGGSATAQGDTYNDYGKKLELMGGSREVPIYNHPRFAVLTPEQVFAVQRAVEEKQDLTFTNENQQLLFKFLSNGTEYFLGPSVVGRISTFETSLPDTAELCKVADPPGLSAPPNTFWVLTGISASPVGSRFEVTREYTSIPAAWEEVAALYNDWSGEFEPEE